MKPNSIPSKGKYTKKKSKRKKAAFINAVVDFTLAFFLAIVPCIMIILYGVGVPIPILLMVAYMAVVPIIVGILFIVFSFREKFGFGKEDYHFGRFSGIRWLSKKEAKETAAFWGGVLIAIGILFVGLTAYYCI